MIQINSVRSQSPTVFIVDDCRELCRSLESCLRSHSFKTHFYHSADEFLRNAVLRHPCCLLLDIALPGTLSGLELQQKMIDNNISISIIFMTAIGTVRNCVSSMKLGAVDFLEKPFEEIRLLQAVHAALAKDHRSSVKSDSQETIQHNYKLLTNRERQIYAMIVRGDTNKAIGIELGISPNTVKVHRSRIMKKMRARSIAHLVTDSYLRTSGPRRISEELVI